VTPLVPPLRLVHRIGFAQVVIELCDGTLSSVEDSVAYFADVVVRYCPWSARLVRLDDYW